MADLPLSDLRLLAFRGLRGLWLDRFGPVNVLVGGNNSGKTSVLESIVLLANPRDPGVWEFAVELRRTWPMVDGRYRPSGYQRLDGIAWLFTQGTEPTDVLDLATGQGGQGLRGRLEWLRGTPPTQPIISDEQHFEASFRAGPGGRKREPGEEASETGLSLDLRISEALPAGAGGPDERPFRIVLWEGGHAYRPSRNIAEPRYPIAFATPFSHRSDGFLGSRVSRLIRAKRKDRAIDLLQMIDARVRDLVMIEPPERDPGVSGGASGLRPSLHVELAEVGFVPVHALGDGLRRALHFAVLVADLDKGGVLLIDEIEVGLHATVLSKVFGWLAKACDQAGVQLFATTHSLEAVDAMVRGMPDEDLVLYRLEDGRSRRYSGADLRVARFELGLEVR